MVRIYTTSIRLEEPIRASFRCEYCDKEFNMYGTVTADQKVETWYREINTGDIAGAVEKAKEKILRMNESFETFLSGGTFALKLDENQTTLRFEGDIICPNCDYKQRISEVRPLKTSYKIRVALFWTMPAAIYLAIIIGGFGNFYTHGSLESLFLALLLAALPIAAYFLMRSRMKKADLRLKKLNLTKDRLPEPRRPVISYGAINILK
jgi:hypothetical protein